MNAALASDGGASYSTDSLRGGLVLAEGASAGDVAVGGVALRSVSLPALHGANSKAAFA